MITKIDGNSIPENQQINEVNQDKSDSETQKNYSAKMKDLLKEIKALKNQYELVKKNPSLNLKERQIKTQELWDSLQNSKNKFTKIQK